jgi:hypothetical protein
MRGAVKVLSVLREEGVPLVNIGAEDICDGNPKLLLGLLWLLILRYHIAQAGTITRYATRHDTHDTYNTTRHTLSTCVWTVGAGNQSGKGGEAEKGGEAKKNLLLWCQSVLNPHGLHPKDFNQSYDSRGFPCVCRVCAPYMSRVCQVRRWTHTSTIAGGPTAFVSADSSTR